jgi:hypothetical protein
MNVGTKFYDVRKFDELLREGTQPATILAKNYETGKKRLIEFKLCQGDWDLGENNMISTTECNDKKANGFMSTQTTQDSEKLSDYTCEFTFGNPTFSNISAPESSVQGYRLQFETEEAFYQDKKFKVTFDIKCDKDAESSKARI